MFSMQGEEFTSPKWGFQIFFGFKVEQRLTEEMLPQTKCTREESGFI